MQAYRGHKIDGTLEHKVSKVSIDNNAGRGANAAITGGIDKEPDNARELRRGGSSGGRWKRE